MFQHRYAFIPRSIYLTVCEVLRRTGWGLRRTHRNADTGNTRIIRGHRVRMSCEGWRKILLSLWERKDPGTLSNSATDYLRFLPRSSNPDKQHKAHTPLKKKKKTSPLFPYIQSVPLTAFINLFKNTLYWDRCLRPKIYRWIVKHDFIVHSSFINSTRLISISSTRWRESSKPRLILILTLKPAQITS